MQRKASRAALVAFEGNHYSVAPAQAGKLVSVAWQVGEAFLRIVSAHGEIVAEHRRVGPGAGQTVRSAEHAAMLQDAVLAAFTTKDACRRKPNLPPGEGALAELAKLRGLDSPGAQVISLARLRDAGRGDRAMTDHRYEAHADIVADECELSVDGRRMQLVTLPLTDAGPITRPDGTDHCRRPNVICPLRASEASLFWPPG